MKTIPDRGRGINDAPIQVSWLQQSPTVLANGLTHSTTNKRWMTPEQCAEFPGVKINTLCVMKSQGVSPTAKWATYCAYGMRLGEAGFNAYDIAKLMGHANISTNQRYVRNLPVGAGEAVMLKKRRHSSARPTLSEPIRAL